MVSAEELLNSVSEVDYSYSTAYCTVSNVSRVITIPENAAILGVEGDRNVKRVYFQMERYFCGHDLTEFEIRINYVNSNGDEGFSATSSIVVSGVHILFSWLIDWEITRYAGNVKFNICARKFDESGEVLQEFNTTLANTMVLRGLVCNRDLEVSLDEDELALLDDADVLAYIESDAMNVCSVDLDTRAISPNATMWILGVENDKNTHIIPFQIPRYYADFDMAKFNIRVNYEDAKGVRGSKAVSNIVVNDRTVNFIWLVGRSVTNHAGGVRFSVCLQLFDDDTVVYELNTIPVNAKVLKGLEPINLNLNATDAMLGVAVLGRLILGDTV